MSKAQSLRRRVRPTKAPSSSECEPEPETPPSDPNASIVVYVERVQILREVLNEDMVACDAKWTLFVAAALSYRYDSKLKPFPPRYVSEQTGVNINELVSVINDMPKLRVVFANMLEENYEELNDDVIALLYWVLVELHMTRLRLISEDEYDELLAGMPQKKTPDRPTHVFELIGGQSAYPYDATTLQNDNEWAFYGGRLDDFHTIIHYGFPLRSDNLPLVLSKELTCALANSPNVAGWGASACGSMIACVALCEYPPDTEMLLRQSKPMGPELLLCPAGDVNDVLRLRYLLFYGSRFPNEDDILHGKASVGGWMHRHKYFLSLACYMLMLVSIGIANSGSAQTVRQVVHSKLQLLLDCCRRVFLIGE